MTRFLVLFLLSSIISYSSFGQTTTEPQPFPLKDYKITFYEVQMNFETVRINQIGGSDISSEKPKIIRNESNDSFTIDFTDCIEGEYLISGKRDDVELEYSVKR